MPGVEELPAPAPTAPRPAPTRRAVIGTTAGLGGAAALAACGSSGGTSASTTTGAAASASSAAGSPPGSGAGSASGAPAGTVLARTSDVPVGGGVVLRDQKVIVVQPAQGTFSAFSAVCTHRGCIVRAPANGVIACPCHNSQFGLDGTVKKGPAQRPLAAVEVIESGGEIRTA